MKKWIVVTALLSLSWTASAQVMGGTAIEAGRVLTVDANFKINNPTAEGVVMIEVAINPMGEVTSARVLTEGTTIKATPLLMRAKNESKKLRFTAGTHYEKFDHVTVKYTFHKVVPKE